MCPSLSWLPKDAPIRFVSDQMFLADLTKHVKETLFDTCVQNTNRGAKPKSLNTKSGLQYKGAFCEYLYSVIQPLAILFYICIIIIYL